MRLCLQIRRHNGYQQLGINNFSTLPKSGSYSMQNLLHLSIQISDGLSYLAEKKVIHGDVAARNVLLCSESHAKLTDFGLSRRLYEYTVYKKIHEVCIIEISVQNHSLIESIDVSSLGTPPLAMVGCRSIAKLDFFQSV